MQATIALKAKWGKTGKQKSQYECRSYSNAKDLMTAFNIDIASDAVEIHPQFLGQRSVKCSVQLYNWHAHTLDTCN